MLRHAQNPALNPFRCCGLGPPSRAFTKNYFDHSEEADNGIKEVVSGREASFDLSLKFRCEGNSMFVRPFRQARCITRSPPRTKTLICSFTHADRRGHRMLCAGRKSDRSAENIAGFNTCHLLPFFVAQIGQRTRSIFPGIPDHGGQ